MTTIPSLKIAIALYLFAIASPFEATLYVVSE